MDKQPILEQVKRAKKEIEEAKKLKCVCSGFTLQYEGGCQCKRKKEINKAQAILDSLISQI